MPKHGHVVSYRVGINPERRLAAFHMRLEDGTEILLHLDSAGIDHLRKELRDMQILLTAETATTRN